VAALVGKDDSFNALVQLHPSLAEASDYEGNELSRLHAQCVKLSLHDTSPDIYA
jgi:hypothetical protein